MSNSTFDVLMDSEGAESSEQEILKPLFTVGEGDEASKWILQTFPALMKRNKAYFEEIAENLKLYKGTVFDIPKSSSNNRLTSEGDPHLEKARNTKLYVNKIHELVEFRVTTHNSAKPGIDIGPANVEYEDKVGSQLAKAVVDSVWYDQDEDEVERKAIRYAVIAGEHFVGTLWDPEKGDVHPEFVKWQKGMKEKAKEAKEMPIEFTDSTSGNTVKYSKDSPVKIGDIVYKHFPAWQVLPEPVTDWDKVTYLMTWEYEYTEALKKQYPKKEGLSPLKENTIIEGFDNDFVKRLRADGKTIVITVWGKRCKYMPNGRYIKATVDGKILVDKDLPYEHDELPLTRLSDMDMPGELRGKSFLRNIKGLQFQHYFLTSMAAANLRLMGYPKWVYEAGSIQIKDLANTRNCLAVRAGAKDPYILQPNPTPPEVYKQIQDLDISMDTKVKGAFSNPAALPKRIDSKAGLEFLSSQDSLRSHTMFSKVNKFRVDLTRQTIKVAGQFYTIDDNRLVKIVGKNHEYELQRFDFAAFNRSYDIRIKEGSALPDEKGARLEYIVTLVEKMPEGTFTTEQILDLLDLSSVEKLFDIGTKSLRAAESIIQDILTGKKVPEPEGYEDLMTYWKTFSTHIQDRQFKESVPKQYKQEVLDYLMTIEYLMWKRAQENPTFAEILTTLPLYPLVYTLPPAAPAPEMPIDPNDPAQMSPDQQDQLVNAEEVNGASELMMSTAANMGPIDPEQV